MVALNFTKAHDNMSKIRDLLSQADEVYNELPDEVREVALTS